MQRVYAVLAITTAVAGALTFGARASAQAIDVPFDSARWTIDAPRAQLTEHLGRRSLRLAGGSAVLNDVQLQDGILEVDVSAPAGGFAFLFFRAASAIDREDVYLRMGAPGSPDALQYQPTFGGMGSWQLYHGPGFTASADFDPKSWTHLRVEVEGQTARVFVGQAASPALVVTELQSARDAGAIGVLEGTSGGTPAGVFFSNFRYTPRPRVGRMAAISAPNAKPSTRPDVIRRWELSSAIAVQDAPIDSMPAAQRDERGWLAVDAEPNGRLNIARYRAKAGFRSLVVARTRIHASHDETRRLVFGYSDDVTIFLNGRPVYAGRNGFRARYPSAAGLMTADDAVYLELRRGTNDLRLAVAEVFGGWGLMARLEAPVVRPETRTSAGSLRVPPPVASSTYPDSAWPVVSDLAAAGYVPARFDTLRAAVAAAGTSAMLVVARGRVVFAQGDVARPTYLASARKSVVSMLYGRYVADGTIRLDATLASLGIDDIGGLLPIERRATVRDLLGARSGVYHPAANLGDASALAPPRGSVRPGTYFLYNNWDFNALGTILERATGRDLYELLERDLAHPLGFQDWARAAQAKRNDTGASRYPAQHIVLSARDMARLGYCMLRGGRWRDVQVIPAAWVANTTRIVTPASEVARTSPFHPRLGYGYLWWVVDPRSTRGSRAPIRGRDPWAGAYSATGSYGQYITVLPAIDVVVAHKVFAPPPPAQQVGIDTYLDRILPLVIAATTSTH